MDNRPLRWGGVRRPDDGHLSATPGPYELSKTGGEFVEQVIRPTGLIDPEIIVKPTKGRSTTSSPDQQPCRRKGERILVTTLTKKMAEDLTDYLLDQGVRVRYLHSEVDTCDGWSCFANCGSGPTTCLSGSTCFEKASTYRRSALSASPMPTRRDSPCSERSLIQTIGRAARQCLGSGPHVRRHHHGFDGHRDR